MTNKKWVLIAFLLPIMALCANATIISLSTMVEMENIVNSTATDANITITNTGDEPAYDVIVEPATVAGISAEQIVIGNVNPNQTIIRQIRVNIAPEAVPGKYSMGVMIRYNDMNNYPFTFVTPLKFFYKAPVYSNVFGMLNEVELAGEENKTMGLSIQNRDEKSHEAVVKLYTPNQISVDEREKRITLPASSETKIDFTVSSLGALPGGNYYIFAIVDYVEEGQHYSVITGNGRIITSKERSYMGMLAPIIIILVIILVVVLVYLQLRKEKPASSESKRAASGKKK